MSGALVYAYDAVGNRLSRTSTIAAIPTTANTFDSNDRLNSDQYDSNGSTTGSDGKIYRYDFENRLIAINEGTPSEIRIVYDGDGKRVSKTVGGVTTKYLVDTNNLTGYAQVVEELTAPSGQPAVVTRVYNYGNDLISQTQLIDSAWATSYYGYDGHGSVRFLTDASGTITDTYTYDAFGNIINRNGTTPNNYLYSGEQWDPDLGFYFLRARYMNPSTGRFWTMDVYPGLSEEPQSLHKYMYCIDSPINYLDPSGCFSISVTEIAIVAGIMGTLAGMATIMFHWQDYKNTSPDAVGRWVHQAIYRFYIPYGFDCDRWIAKSDHPLIINKQLPMNKTRPDARMHDDWSPFAGEVYEIKPLHLYMEGYYQLMDYIQDLRRYYPETPWRPGASLLAENPLHVPQVPGILFDLSMPAPGIIAYEARPDYMEGIKVGITVATLTFLILLLNRGASPRFGQAPEVAPI